MTVTEQPCKITIASNLTLHLETGRSCFRNSVPGNKQALANTNKLRRKNFSKNPDLSDEYTHYSGSNADHTGPSLKIVLTKWL